MDVPTTFLASSRADLAACAWEGKAQRVAEFLAILGATKIWGLLAERALADHDLSRDSVTCLPPILILRVPTYGELMETTTVSRTTITGWVAILAVLAIVVGGIDQATRTDPVGWKPAYPATGGAVNPALPP